MFLKKKRRIGSVLVEFSGKISKRCLDTLYIYQSIPGCGYSLTFKLKALRGLFKETSCDQITNTVEGRGLTV